ncbi:class I SAM-dependent methyltransferase [Myxococcota bacterium]|nr:class I SAM-dependent methyltransferase [Myxococcota bacterium]MBU1896669.1 class I SAM-dependent methyltransferase [Myxococcota bacterium]
MDPRLLCESYDRFAHLYDEIFEPQQAPKIQALRAAMPPHQAPLLDLGAGTGLWARLTGQRVIALDGSRGMLAQATGQRIRGRLDRLPFRDACFGGCVSVTALIDYVDPTPTIREVWRVLKPGAPFALSVLKREDLFGLERAIEATGFRALDKLDLVEDMGFILKKP